MINVLHSTAEVEVVGRDELAELKRIAAEHPMRRSRLCLHRSPGELTHEMIIVAHRSTYIRAHRHPRHKSESYHVIEGELEVRLFADDGSVARTITLGAAGNSFLFRAAGGIWHQPVPLTEWVVYHEAYSGPFDKDTDVEYAPWAPQEETQ